MYLVVAMKKSKLSISFRKIAIQELGWAREADKGSSKYNFHLKEALVNRSLSNELQGSNREYWAWKASTSEVKP